MKNRISYIGKRLKAQGALEYLLLLGGVLIVVVVVIQLLVKLTYQGNKTVSEAAQALNKSFHNLSNQVGD